MGGGIPRATEARPKCWGDPGVSNGREEETDMPKKKLFCAMSPLISHAALLDLAKFIALMGPVLSAHPHLTWHNSLPHPQGLGTAILPNRNYETRAFCFEDSHKSLLEIICSNFKGIFFNEANHSPTLTFIA